MDDSKSSSFVMVAGAAGLARFWRKVAFLGAAEGDCWEWRGGRKGGNTGQRYGQFTLFHGKQVLAHRFAYEAAFGPVPEGRMVCHSCDNTLCCNPSHLFHGTAKDNTADMMAKKRDAFGGRRHRDG